MWKGINITQINTFIWCLLQLSLRTFFFRDLKTGKKKKKIEREREKKKKKNHEKEISFKVVGFYIVGMMKH